MNQYEAHVTDEWQTDTMVIQVREMAANDTTRAIGYMAEDRDGMATMAWHQIDYRKDGREHLVPTPGVRIRHDVAVAMARAILLDAGKDADRVEELERALADLEMTAHESAVEVQRQMARADDLQNQVNALERLVEAKDAHLEREARVATLGLREAEREQAEADVRLAQRLHPARLVTDEPATTPLGTPRP